MSGKSPALVTTRVILLPRQHGTSDIRAVLTLYSTVVYVSILVQCIQLLIRVPTKIAPGLYNTGRGENSNTPNESSHLPDKRKIFCRFSFSFFFNHTFGIRRYGYDIYSSMYSYKSRTRMSYHLIQS